MKKISVYATGDRNSVSYYRIWQYIDKLDNVKISEHTKYMKFLMEKYYPIGSQPVHIKIIAWICMNIKIFCSLCFDLFFRPDFILLQRCFVKKKMPLFFRLLINILVVMRTKIIWDFDDNILASGEINKSDFSFLAKKSFQILVTHDYLKKLIPHEFQEKVVLFRTTDGDMFRIFQQGKNEITESRLESLKKEINIIWVATKGNIPYVENVLPALDKAAQRIAEIDGRILNLKVVCNGKIEKKTKNLRIDNITWTRDRAINEMICSHIGIMPLIDSDFAKGKGAFKLVQYMSIGLPCIASAVGFNCNVIDDSFGYLAYNEEDWVNAIVKLINPIIWKEKSLFSYNKWEKDFSFEKNLFFLKKILQS